MKSIYQVLTQPHLTEKALKLKEEAGYIAFRVHQSANKAEIREAVQKIFEVKVESVRIVNIPAKPRRMGRFSGHKSGYKKALVKLKPGEKSIDYFENL